VALVLNSGHGTPFGDLRIARVSGAALASVRERRRRLADAPALRIPVL
jgi:hypothetical protein